MAGKIDPKTLEQEWVHSHEEDSPGQMVFRPKSYSFPPSRGRKSFRLSSDGSLGTSGIGPDDRSIKGQGRWRIDASDKLTLQPATGGAAKSVMQILHVDPDKLVVKSE